jgi:fucose 4-O-acetylase-like acetyltransferase
MKEAEVKPKERVAYWDNAKFILIFLVVLGHFLEYIPNSKIVFAIYDFIYLFHMPAFVLIAGFFSKNTSSILKRIIKYFIYYFIFSLYYLPISFRIAIPFLLNPYWIMWYLLSLIFWNLLLIPFKHIKFSVPLAFIIGIAVGYINNIGNFLSLSRTFVFFPFFLIGYYFEEKYIDMIGLKTKITASFILIFLFLLGYFYKIPSAWLYGSTSYINLGVSEWYAGGIRLWIYVISALTCICVLILVPKKRYKITYMGENTLNVYVLHGIFVFLLSGLVVFQNLSAFLKMIFSCFFTVLLIIILSNKIIGKTINIIIETFTRTLLVLKKKAKSKSNLEKF